MDIMADVSDLSTDSPLKPLTIREALLQSGLSVRAVKEALAKHGLDGAALCSTLPDGLLAELEKPPAEPAKKDAPPPQSEAIRARLERTRLLLHRYALFLEPVAALPFLLPATSQAEPGGLRLHLGLQSPPQEVQAESLRIEQLLHKGVTGPPSEAILLAALGLDEVALDALWLLAAPLASPRFLWLLDRLCGASTTGALTLAFLRHLLGNSRRVDEVLAQEGPLLRYALIIPAGGDRYQISPRIYDLLVGDGTVVEETLQSILVPGPTPAQPPRLPEAAEAALVRLREAGVDRLLITGPEGSGARAVSHRLAAELGRVMLEVDLRAVARNASALPALLREAHLQRAVLLLGHGSILAGEAFSIFDRGHLLATLRRERVPLVLDAGPTESLDLSLGFGVSLGLRHLALNLPGPHERAALWEETLRSAHVGEKERVPLVQAVRAFPIGVDHMADAVRLAEVTTGRIGMAADALRHACDLLVTHHLGKFAAKIYTRARWADLVVPEDVAETLTDFVQHARLSRHVLDELGYGKQLGYGRGLSALLSGPSGTGKTMAATLIAQDLGVELYRVDLATVVSKYIGETEERLGRVFVEAAATGAALLFDEADALFAKRTDVKSSTDRYANLEVNFLLQKLEEHDGITLLTTNFFGSLDSAFLRRIRFHIQFPEPDVGAREKLWRSMIPPQAPIEGQLNFKGLAQRYEFKGGAIRNAILRAAFRAAARSRPLRQSDLDESARAELTAMGRLE
jgi:hypothetical protein